MSFVQKVSVALTTAADGSATAYSDPVTGRVLAIHYIKPSSSGFDNGSTITVTAENTGEAIWSESSVNASASRYPRSPTHSAAGVVALYAAGGTGVNEPIALAADRVKFVIASGGNTKNATFYVVVG